MAVESYVFFSLPARAVRRGILFIEDYSTGNDGKRISPSFIHRVPAELPNRERIIRSSKIGGHER